MTPAEELTAAADRLYERAEAATEGPWWTEASSATGQNVIQGGMVAQDLWLKVAGHVRSQDAEYIVAMDPRIGKALAKHMRHEAEWSERYALNGLRFDGHPALLEIARLIVGGDE